MRKHWFRSVIILFAVIMLVLSILAGIEGCQKKAYIRDKIKVGQEFKGSEFAEMTDQRTEWTKYNIGYGLVKVKHVFFTVKNDTIVSVWTGYGLP